MDAQKFLFHQQIRRLRGLGHEPVTRECAQCFSRGGSQENDDHLETALFDFPPVLMIS